MEKKKFIRKIFILAAWFLVIMGITTLLIAANRRQKGHVCKEVLIGIKGQGEKYYVEKNDVLQLIEKSANGSLVQKTVTTIDLRKMEKALESNAWISHAELYFDSRDALHVFVEERQPVARIFTTAGNSFYIDSSGHKMPLLEKMSARVPVITNFTNAKKWNAHDSSMMQDVKQVAVYVFNHPFWNAQIGQIDITPENKFELIPVIGNHVIRIGSAENIDEKLQRLYVFYQQVMSKVGFNKYAALDVEYAGEVVAVNKGATSAVDSIQLQKNIQELVNRASLQDIDEEMLPAQNTLIPEKDSTVSKTDAQMDQVPVKTNSNPIEANQPNPNPAKPKIHSKPIEKPKQTNRQPKAVMRRE